MTSSPVVVLDIETIGREATFEEEQAFRDEWSPPSNWKDEVKIHRAREAAVGKWKAKRALSLDGAQMISMAICSINGTQTYDMEVCCSKDEAEVAKFFAAYMNDMGCACHVVGFNHLKFDLPIINRALHQNNLSLEFPIGKWSAIDLMNTPYKHGLSLKALASCYGVRRGEHVEDIDGSKVGELFEKGELATIEAYNISDTRITAELYIAMKRMWQI